MPLAEGAISPVKDFLKNHMKLSEKDFVESVQGPLIMFRLAGETPAILNLNVLRQAGQHKIVLGRRKSCDLRFGDVNISGQHAILEFHNDEWNLIDRGSTNGTFIDESRIPSHQRLVLRDRVKYSLAQVVELQIWQAGSFHQEMAGRKRQSARKPAREVLRRSHDRATAMHTRRMFLASGRMYKSRQSKARDLLRFSSDIERMSSQEFLNQFPCPFLILMSSTEAPPSLATGDTAEAFYLVRSRGMTGLKFWPIASLQNSTEILIGRGPNCDIVIDHPTVSKIHGVFSYKEETNEWRLENLKSKNGILIDGTSIEKPVILKDEIILRFGKEVMLQFMFGKTFQKFTQLYALTQNPQ